MPSVLTVIDVDPIVTAAPDIEAMPDDPSSAPLPETAHSAAIQDVNRWRGHCIDLFARIDEAVAAALEAMAAKNPKANVRTPHLFGQRIAALHAALQPDQPLAAKTGQILKTLDKLEPLLAQRNILQRAQSGSMREGDGFGVTA